MTKEMAIDALDQALAQSICQSGAIFYSDRGSQYAAYDYQDKLRNNGIRQSMNAKGDCYDNACMESFLVR